LVDVGSGGQERKKERLAKEKKEEREKDIIVTSLGI